MNTRTSLLLLLMLAALLVGETWHPNRTIAHGDLLIYFPTLVQTPWEGAWNPWVGLGENVVANPQRGYFYPLAWPLRWAFFAWLPFYLWLHYVAAGLFSWRWLSGRTGDGPALVGAVFYMMCGPAASLVTKLDKLPGYALLPAFLWGLDQAAQRRNPGIAIASGAVALAWFGGSVEGVVFMAIAGLVFAGKDSGRLRSLITAVALGLMLAAPSVLPFLELLTRAARGAGEVTSSTMLATEPSQLWRLLAPTASEEQTYFSSLYLGITAVAVALWGWRAQTGWGLVAMGALLSLGGHTPLYRLVHAVPVLSDLRFPEKWWLLGIVGFALVVAHGAAAPVVRRIPLPVILTLFAAEHLIGFRLNHTWSEVSAYAPSSTMVAVRNTWDHPGIPLVWDESLHTSEGLPRWPGTTLARDLHAITYPNTGVWHGVGYVYGTSALRTQALVETVQDGLRADVHHRQKLMRDLGADYWLVWDKTQAAMLAEAWQYDLVTHEPQTGTVLPVGLLKDPHPAPLAEDQNGAAVEATFSRDRIHLEAQETGPVLVRTAWDPGWQMAGGTIEPQGALMKVPAAGPGEITLRFVPRFMRLGVVISIVALAVLILRGRRPGRVHKNRSHMAAEVPI